MANEKLIADIQSADKDVRFAAWRGAGGADASAIADLSKLVGAANPGVAKAAREALTTMVHAMGKDAAHPNRPAAVQQLLAVASAESSPFAARVHALRLLSNIAGQDAVPALARLFRNEALREEAIYAVERVPGEASNKALLAALAAAKDDFKPRVLAALGHRRVAEAAQPCADAMRSSNADAAAAAARAYGRIGRKAAGSVTWPKTEDPDSVLRFADGQREQGNASEALRIYKTMLTRAEEHLQCAGIIGLSKLKTAEAVAAIFPLLKHSNPKVRITAANAWKATA
ncbi:MAG: hypothetical protein HYZ37_12785 [Candidatus Solibacter usitatus]|nr:hypothetical protein [Candidatus Solibacter usitatus]